MSTATGPAWLVRSFASTSLNRRICR